MNEECFYLCGSMEPWPTKLQLATMLKEAGLRIYVGRYSIRIEDFDHFVFQEYGGDLGDPQIEADSETREEMIRQSSIISGILASRGVKHRFEIYGDSNTLIDYQHHRWPLN